MTTRSIGLLCLFVTVKLVVGTVAYAQEFTPMQDMAGEWNLSDFHDGKTRNEVSEGRSLVAQYFDSSSKIEKSEENGVVGVHLQGGANLLGSTETLNGLNVLGEPSKSFTVSIQLVPKDYPSGYYGGIFQAMKYGESGFRLLLRKDLNIVVETSPGGQGNPIQGFVSSSPLELGKTYDISLRYKEGKWLLYINGELDGEFESSHMTPYSGEFRVGWASGNDYNFNGLIGRVSISTE